MGLSGDSGGFRARLGRRLCGARVQVPASESRVGVEKVATVEPKWRVGGRNRKKKRNVGIGLNSRSEKTFTFQYC